MKWIILDHQIGEQTMIFDLKDLQPECQMKFIPNIWYKVTNSSNFLLAVKPNQINNNQNSQLERDNWGWPNKPVSYWILIAEKAEWTITVWLSCLPVHCLFQSGQWTFCSMAPTRNRNWGFLTYKYAVDVKRKFCELLTSN